MPNNQTSINIGVKYNVEQASLNSLKKSLQDLQKIDIGNFNGSERQLEKLKNEIRQVENAFKRAFNQDLGTLKVQDFNKSLLKIYGSSENVYKSFAKFGAKGQAAFSQMASSVLTTNLQLRQTHSLINQMGQTMANTVKWGVASSVMNNFTNSVQQAFQYVKGLDSALTDIRIVTGQSAQEMQSFAAQANSAAQSLGRSTMDYTKAALTFYQQGLSDVDVQARTEAVLKAQNITGAGDEMADYLTAVWNGYKVANEEAELYVDKLAAVADSSASNMSQLAIAMSKVASTANTMGVDVDQLNAQIATIVATTRQAPQSVGNALKTIYSRINDIATGADDAQISLGNYSAKMAEVGINVLDANGKLRDTGEVFEEIGGKWASFSKEQQIYLARTMAGQRQINNMTALFDNWGKYSDLVNISMDSQGTLVEKNSRYMESLAAKMEQLGAAGERVKSALIDENDLKGIVQAGTSAVNVFANLIESIGGGKGALLNFGSVFAQVFSGTISKEISNVMVAAQNKAFNQQKIQGAKDRYNQYAQYFNSGIAKDYVDDLESFYNYEKVLSDEDKKIQLGLIQRRRELREEQTILEESRKIAEKYYNSISKKDLKEASDTKIGVALDVAKKDLEKIKQLTKDFSGFQEMTPGTNKETNIAAWDRDTKQWVVTLSESAQKLKSNQELATQYIEKINEVFKNRNINVENIPLVKLLRKIEQEGSVSSDRLEKIKQLENDLIQKQENATEELKNSGRTQTLLERNRRQQEDINNNDYLPRKSAAQIQKQTQDVVKFTAGLSQMLAVMNNIKNLGSIWQNKDISAGEKILQTITNLGMSAPMAVTGFLSMKDALPGVIGTVQSLATRLSATGTAAATTAGQLGQIAMAVGPYVAIFAGVAAAIYLIYKEWNKENQAAKKAAQTAQKTKQAYEELKSTYENLKSSLENYNSAKEAIAEMTKGTQEWRDAIRESNDAVLDLIQSYPELADAVQNVNGQLIISTQAQQEALQKAAAAVDTARLANMSAEGASRDASLRAEARNASRFAGQISYSGDFIQATTDQVMRVVEAYSTATDRSVQALSEQTGMSEQLVSSILTEVDNMDQLAAQLQANTEALKLNYQTLVSEKFQGNAFYEGLDDLGKQVAQTIGASQLQRLQNEYYQEALEQTQKGIFPNSGAGNENVKAILEAINKARGTNWGLDSDAVQGTDTNRTFHFLNDEGQPVTLNKEQVAHILAAQKASQEILNSLDKTRQVLKDIDNISNKTFSTALKDFIGNQGFGNLTKAQLEQLDASAPQMQAFFKEHGAELGEDFEESFIQAQKAAQKDWELLGKDSLQPVQNTIAEFFKGKNFSLQTAKNISVALDSAFKQVGNTGVESLTNLFDDSTQNIDQIIKAISSADISTPEGLQELTKELQKIGDGSFAASEQWQNFVNQVSQTQFENPLDSIFERQQSVNKITKGLNKYSIISEEDYTTLLQINPQIDALFSRVAEGYQFIGQKGSLMELLTGGTNGYIQAANRFDSLKESATKVAQSFGKDFEASLLEGNSLSDAVNEAIKQVDTQEGSKQLWAGLNTNEDYIKAVVSRYKELTDAASMGFQTEKARQELEGLQTLLQSFLGDAANIPDILDGVTESLRQAAALGAQSLSELNDLFANDDINGQQFGKALQKVSDTQMSNLGFDVDEYQEYVNLLQLTNQQLEKNQYLARQMAKANMRISKGMDDLIQGFDQWNDALLDFQENGDMSRLADSWGQIRQAMSNLFDSDVQAIDMLGPDFIANNLDKIQAVKDGVDGAYEQLDALMDQQLILNAYGVSDFSQLDQDIQDAYNKIQEVSNDATIQVGAVFTGDDDLVKAFNTIVENANWTSEQAQAAFADMGYDVQVEPSDPQMHEDTESTQYYVPPTYRMVQKPFNFGPFGRGTMLLPELDREGHYESAGGGIKQSYEPGAYAIKTVTKNGKGSGGRITRGAARSATPRSSSSRGGGGGNSGRSSTPKAATQAKVSTAKIENTVKTPDHNPYEQEQKSYQRQSKILDDLKDKQKKLVNKDRLKNLQDQNKTLKEQERILRKELDISKNSAQENSTADYARRLADTFGNAFKLDADGQISNINALERNAAEAYNAAAKSAADAFERQKQAYNNYIANTWNAYATQDEQELHKGEKEYWDQRLKDAEQSSKDIIKKAEEEYKTREDLINSYTKAWEADQKRLDQIKQIQEQIIQNQIAASKIKVDLSIDTGEFERDWLDFENKFIKKLNKDDFLGNAKANVKELMSYFDSNQIQETNREIGKIQQQIQSIKDTGTSSIYGDNLAQAQEDLEQYMKQQMDSLGDIQDLVDDVKENYLDALDNAKDKMDDQIDQYERVNDLIDHNVKLTQLLYGDKAYNTMNKYYELQKSNNKDQLQSLKMQQKYWQDLFNGIQKDKDGKIINQEEYDTIKKNLDDVTDNLNSKLEQMIENLSDQWQNRVDGIIAKLNNALTGGRGLDYLDEQWDYINTFDDNFLDTFESKMGIQEVTDLYQQAIDGLSGSPANQQKINKLMNEQLKILREKDNLTQYDIDRAKAALEVQKARMALEDARFNKTKMRLRRDSQGNYTYQYVADEQKLGDLQSALADAQANLYNMDKEHYKENLNTLYDAYKDYIEKMRDLTEEYNSTQDAEERKRIQARIDLLKESTNNLMQGLTEDNKYALQYLNDSFFDGMGIDTTVLSAEQQMEIMTQNIPQMQSNIQDLANTLVGQGGILNATNDAMKQISKATSDYDKNVKQFLTDAGTSLNVVTNVTDKAGNALDQNIKKANDLITTNQKLIDECNAQVDAIQKVLSYLDQFMNKVIGVETLVSNLRAGYNTGQQLNGSNLTADEISVANVGLDSTKGMNYTGGFTGNPRTDAAAVKTQINDLLAQYEKFLTQMTIATFDTGGYTGTWGDAEGRLAFLHQGELVLNQDDTTNILNAVQIVRSMASAINSIASGEINSLMSGASGLLGGINNTEQLDQNVHIEANFPNVTQHTEIEQAFENLVNMASMRASRYRD